MERRNKIIISGALLLVITLVLLSAANTLSSTSGKFKTIENLRHHKNEAFGFGEKLEYKVGYKFITAGTGYFHIQPEPIYRNGRKCFDVRFRVQSLKSLEWIYRVDDAYRTVLDESGIFPWEFEQRIREGNYKRDSKAFFDQLNNTARVKNKVYPVPDYVHDIVSALYYVRTLNIGEMRKGEVIKLQNFFDDSTYTLGVRILGKETVQIDAGKFRCVVVEPLVVEGGLFESEGKIVVWLTDDERKIPVKVATKILIGYVSAELTNYSGVRGPVAAKL